MFGNESQHRSDLNRGKHHSGKLQTAWEYYGEDRFTLVILEEISGASELVAREQFYLATENCAYNNTSTANNVAAIPPVDKDKMRQLILFLERDANMTLDAIFLQHLCFAIEQGVVNPGPRYHLLMQATKANIPTWEAFQDFVVNSSREKGR